MGNEYLVPDGDYDTYTQAFISYTDLTYTTTTGGSRHMAGVCGRELRRELWEGRQTRQGWRQQVQRFGRRDFLALAFNPGLAF